MRVLYASLIAPLMLALLIGIAGAQYWFQTGAIGTYNSSGNYGAAATIETSFQNVTDGSFGFWVGESLSNGAFVQVGYEVENQSGYYPTNCSINGCNGSTYIAAGVPTWFWEYFPKDYNGSAFLGSIGPNDSAGAQGSFNTYAMNSSGTVWNFYFNGQNVGSVDIGTAQSGANPPTAIGELAATNTNSQYMNPVMFKNLKYFFNGGFIQVPVAYSTISYGKGSNTSLQNPYGIEEVGSYTNFFEVGSGLPLNNQSKLWSIGYKLQVISDYGNISSENNYSGSSVEYIDAPKYVYISNTTREKFIGWAGSGYGSYSGARNYSSVLMVDNITENAQWQRQYYVNVSSEYGTSGGSGWYNSGAPLILSEYPKEISVGTGARVLFSGWNSTAGIIANSATTVKAPMTVYAEWDRQYLVNVTSTRGIVIGNGWYDNGSTAHIGINNYTEYTSNSSRITFRDWSNGSTAANFTTIISGPIMLAASFGEQYSVDFVPEDIYGNQISAASVDVSGINLPTGSTFMFPGIYEIDYVMYKGAQVSVNSNITISGPSTVPFKAQVYNVSVEAKDEFGSNVNASASLTFENGTTFNGYLGPTGMVTFADVPYGHVSGYIYYKSMKHQVSASYGSNIVTTFIDPVTFVPLLGIAIVVIAIALHTYRSRRLRR